MHCTVPAVVLDINGLDILKVDGLVQNLLVEGRDEERCDGGEERIMRLIMWREKEQKYVRKAEEHHMQAQQQSVYTHAPMP